MPRSPTATVLAAVLCAGLANVLGAPAAEAQIRPSVFASAGGYEEFVNRSIMSRDFVPLVRMLGGDDEYTEQQLASVNQSLLNAFPRDFENTAVIKRVELMNGFVQEARAYWTGAQYGWYYALLHDTGSELVVISFSLNTDVAVILDRF